MPYDCIVVDDNKDSVEIVSDYISNFDSLRIVAVYRDAIKALNEIPLDKKVHFIFMDIDMPGMLGTELAKIIRNKTDFLIFITGHNKFAAESYAANANGYLLKPFGFEQFAAVINKLLVTLSGKNREQDTASLEDRLPYKPYFFVNQLLDDGNTKKVKIVKNDLIYAESALNNVYIHTSTDENIISIYMALAKFFTFFNGDPYVRQVHRAFIVNTDKIIEYTKKEIAFRKNDNKRIPIGGEYQKAFLRYMDRKEGRTGPV